MEKEFELEEMVYRTYRKFIEVGFSDEQAFELVKTMLGNMRDD